MKKVFTIHIDHNYFAEMPVPIGIFATASTTDILDKNDFILRKVDEKIEVFSRTDDVARDIDNLCFFVSFKNPYLWNISDLPKLDNEDVFYFKNITESEKLHGEKFDAITYRCKELSFLVKENTEENITLKNINEEEVIDATITSKLPLHQENLSSYNEGRYQLYLNKEEKLDFVLLHTYKPNNVIGFIEISLQHIQKDSTPNYTISIPARKAKIQYLVKQHDNHVFEIEDEEKEVQFEKLGLEGYGKNVAFQIFQSNKKIPLEAKMRKTFKLLSNQKTVIEQLPGPILSSVKLHPNKEEYYSEIFINI